ncbi:MAG: LacI family transcriptional regulator [Arcanobacterium sp.]|nr:LacI family transcriptional regulator [Arcanobacterium sp.]MDY5589710.1 LacI family DNA-binding transcriptional regulator [Arcanobacterium sp.]
MAKKVTIYDIAAAAKVSPSTVSRALRQPDRVSTDTSAKIFQIADTLGYSREGAAYADEARLTKTLAIVIADLGNPMYAQVLEGFQRTATQNGYTTLIINSEESGALEQKMVRRIVAGVDGVALASSRLDAGSIKTIEKITPLVLLNRFLKGHTCILPDTVRGMEKLCAYLNDLGHSRVLYLAGPERSWANAIRWRALQKTAAHYKIAVNRTPYAQPSIISGATGVDNWEAHRASAVLAYNDLMAAGFSKEAQRRKIKIPDDVSLIGIDNSSICALTSPELSSLSSASEEIGQQGAESLMWQATHRSQRERRTITVPIEFIPRASTGRAHQSNNA